ncbi:MAG TPA: hypothetical protein VKZ18_27605 [Polyangia bacterium]|nr:hypothetical protein [Polyangia bacterium]
MLRRGLWWGLAASLVLAGSARGGELMGLAAANVAEGITNNALSAPDGSSAVGADSFTIIHASLSATERGPLHDQGLAYTYMGTFYATHSVADAQTHSLYYYLNAAPTGQTAIRALATGAYGVTNSVNPIAATAALNPQSTVDLMFTAVPSGAITYLTGTASAVGMYRPTPQLLWQETTLATTFDPLTEGEVAHTFAISQDFRHEHQWARDAFTADLSVGYLDAAPFVTSLGFPEAEVQNLQGELLVGWRRQFSPFWNASLELGVLALDSLNRSGDASVGPAGRAIAHYQNEPAYVDLTLQHSTQLNVYLGQVFLADSAMLRAVLMLDRRERFRATAFGTAERASEIVPGGGLDKAFDLLTADVGLGYHPLSYPVLASLEYIIQDQIGYEVAGSLNPSLHRQAVMLTLTALWGTNAAWGVAGSGSSGLTSLH